MNNLRTFLNYRSKCFICNSELGLCFIFRSQSETYYIQSNELVVTIPISAYPMSSKSFKFNIQYHIDIDNNDFYVNFLDNKNNVLDRVSMLSRERYLSSYNSLVKSLVFFKNCSACKRYNYSSKAIKMNHQTCKVESLEVGMESFCLGNPNEDGSFQAWMLINNYMINQSSLIHSLKLSREEFEEFNTNSSSPLYFPSFIETHVISVDGIESQDKLIKKLKLFLTLS